MYIYISIYLYIYIYTQAYTYILGLSHLGIMYLVFKSKFFPIIEKVLKDFFRFLVLRIASIKTNSSSLLKLCPVFGKYQQAVNDVFVIFIWSVVIQLNIERVLVLPIYCILQKRFSIREMTNICFRRWCTVEVFRKKVFLEISQNSQGSTCARLSFFNKVAILRPATLLKKRVWHRCFPVNFVKYLRTPFFEEHLWWLLLMFGIQIMEDFKTF